VPGSAEVTTDMHFGLSPTTTLHKNADGTFTYALTVKKQPGTLAVPIAVRIRLPSGASVVDQTPTGTAQGQDLVFAQTLQQDQQIRVVFRLP
jgi:hypothetical protein